MSDIKTQLQHRPGMQIVAQLRVEVVDGPDRGLVAGGSDTLSIGTAQDNSLVVGDLTVSRYHLELSAKPDGGGVLVTDLGSTNGTYLGAARIERALVPPGTPITLGATTIRFDDADKRAVRTSSDVTKLAGMLSRAPAMIRMFADIRRVAPASTSVLIVGESGTGKERVAEALHEASARSDAPFVTIDCGALSSSLLASELFGHERGAFTGADRIRVGAFERAAGGTVFLDEIGELPTADQAALLGVIERRRFRRVGGSTDHELTARVVSATNRDLRAEVNNGRFRHDLYHRLAVVVLRLPPLRDRAEDVLPLVDHFAHELGGEGTAEQLFGAETLLRWQRHPWPGNIRELRNAVEAALVGGTHLVDEPVAAAQPSFSLGEGPVPPYRNARAIVVGAFERAYLVRLLADAGGNVSQAARIARMDRSHLIDLLERHKLKD